jgi:hypothetical protein
MLYSVLLRCFRITPLCILKGKAIDLEARSRLVKLTCSPYKFRAIIIAIAHVDIIRRWARFLDSRLRHLSLSFVVRMLDTDNMSKRGLRYRSQNAGKAMAIRDTYLRYKREQTYLLYWINACAKSLRNRCFFERHSQKRLTSPIPK